MNEEEETEQQIPVDNETEKADREIDIEREDNPMGGIKMPTLDQIAIKHGADKSSKHHCYCRIYEKYFEPIRFTAKKILEIGIDGGASMRTWAEYFPCARIFGIDHNSQFIANARNNLDLRRIEPIFGDVTDPAVFGTEPPVFAKVREFGDDMDVIIDDGGHYSHQIIPAFGWGWKLLKSGGLYCIEDTHHVYRHENPRESGKLFDFLQSEIHVMNEHGIDQCGKPTTSDIAFIHFTKSLCIIGKV